MTASSEETNSGRRETGGGARVEMQSKRSMRRSAPERSAHWGNRAATRAMSRSRASGASNCRAGISGRLDWSVYGGKIGEGLCEFWLAKAG